MGFQLWKKKNEITVQKFNNQENNSEFALLSFDGKIRDQIIKHFNNHFLVEGDHIKNGGVSSPKTMLSIIGSGAGSLGIAGATSGQLFMATANPATLMAIGNGVGSAVVGSTGIVAQAPFIPVTGALMPVVAPLIAFQVISTLTIMNEFQKINEKLDNIQKTINDIIKRDEATFLGEIISASNRISDIQNQFAISNKFTNDMIIRLALLEDKINPIFERYNYLYSNNIIQSTNQQYNKTEYYEHYLRYNIDDFKFKQSDAYMAVISSILDIRIDLLRIKLNIQENPGYLNKSAYQLTEKVGYYKELWQNIRKNGEDIQHISNDISRVVDDMSWWSKNAPNWLGGKSKQIEKLKHNSINFEKQKLDLDIIDNAEDITKKINPIGMESNKELDTLSHKTNLVYWRDDKGENSYYTDDIMIN